MKLRNFVEKKGIDYEKVKNIATLDHRITRNHTNVPGHDENAVMEAHVFQKIFNPYIIKCKK